MLNALILCGGKSSRMGRDKGLLQHEQITWAQHAAEKFVSLNLPYFISINGEQNQEYVSIFDKDLLVEDNAAILAEGPLKGILSLHQKKPKLDMFVLACDMRDMQREVLKYLVSTYSINKGEVVVFSNGHQAEPLCAIYTANGLQRIAAMLQAGQARNWGLQYFLPRLDTFYLPIPDKWIPYFRNFNSKEDLL